MKRLFYLGASHADIPILKAAKRLGYYVITSGNNPKDLGHQFADEYVDADYSDYKQMLETAKSLKIDAICPAANDFSALSAAYIAESLGFKNYDSFATLEILHHKDKYRDFAKNNSIPTPFAYSFTEAKSAIDFFKNKQLFPLIIKPIDLSGGKGVSVVHSQTELENNIGKAFALSKARRIVIEEYLTGSNHGASMFLQNGKVAFSFFDNEYYYKNPFLVSAASTPSAISNIAKEELIKTSNKIASLLKLANGIFHLQFINSAKGPIITEICRRTPGDLYIRLIEIATGLDYSSLIVKAFTGQDLPNISETPPKGFFLRHCIMASKSGKISKVTYDKSIKDKIIEEFSLRKEGDLIEDHLNQKLGIIFLKFSSLEEMLDQSARMQDLIKVSIS